MAEGQASGTNPRGDVACSVALEGRHGLWYTLVVSLGPHTTICTSADPKEVSITLGRHSLNGLVKRYYRPAVLTMNIGDR